MVPRYVTSFKKLNLQNFLYGHNKWDDWLQSSIFEIGVHAFNNVGGNDT